MDKPRRKLIFLVATIFGAPVLFAQPTHSQVVIGWLEGGSRTTDGHRLIALKEGLAALGWKEGAQYVIEERWAEGKKSGTISR